MHRLAVKRFYQGVLYCILIVSPLTTPVFAETNIDRIQNQALDMVKQLPSGQNGQAQKDLKKVFDYYDRVGTDSAMPKQPGSTVSSSSVEQEPNVTKSNTKPRVVSAINRAVPMPQQLAKLPQDAYPEDRDPFALTSRLIRQDTAPKNTNSVHPEQDRAYSFTRLKTGVNVPKLTLRGLILKSEKEKAAILEVEGMGTYVVREGDTISIPDGGFNNVIKVTQIDRLSLLIEVGKLGEVIIVR